LLNVNLSELLLEGWRKQPDFARAMTQTTGEGSSTARLDLPAQSIQITLEPSVDILLDGVRTATIQVTANVKCDMGASVVIVRNGLIDQARGKCDANIALMLQGVTVASKQFRFELADVFESA
jgi:hypothetical protein